MTPPDSPTPPPSRRRCPICGRSADPRYRPFCSSRCATIDLGRWLKGAYRIGGEEPAEEGEAGERDRD